MLTPNSIIDAVNDLLVEKYPKAPVYVNLRPKDFERPSFLVELVDMKRADVNYSTVSVAAKIAVTCFVDVDGRYNSDVVKLAEKQGGVMDMFANGYLAVGDRCISVEAAEGGIDFSDCYVDLQLAYFDDRPIPGETLPLMDAVITATTLEG